MFDRNHYIQNRLLKNFATKAENGKHKICILNLINFSVEIRNTDSVFYEHNFYDVNTSSDTKELEKKINNLIENPMVALLDKICASKDKVTITRAELNTIKKYFLLQLYRTPSNKRAYADDPKCKSKFSQYNIADGEGEEDFWKREMSTIADSDWYALLQSNMVGIRKFANQINNSFVMIVRTDSEFCINDIGYVTERMPLQLLNQIVKRHSNNATSSGQMRLDEDNLNNSADCEIDIDGGYIDNYCLYPISSHYAILLVSPIWRHVHFNPDIANELPSFSPILQKYLTFPKHDYVNKSKIHVDSDVAKYMDEQDKFIYTICNISNEDTMFLNNLTMNEAYCFVCVKTPATFIPSVKMYNYRASIGQQNLHHNFNGYVELLKRFDGSTTEKQQ